MTQEINETVGNSADQTHNQVEDTVLVSFSIPKVDKLAGCDATDAHQAVLGSQATLYSEAAAKLSKGVKESINPLLDSFESYGETVGQLDGESNDEFCKKTVNAKLPNGVKVSMPVSTIFAQTVVAMVKHITKGGIPLAKWDKFDFSKVGLSLLKGGVSNTNAGRDNEWKPVTHSHGEFVFEVKAAGVDTAGKLVGFYEVLVKAAQAVYVHQDELRALELIDGMASKTGLHADNLKTVVQAIVNATCASEFRRQASHYADKAKLTSSQRVQAANANKALSLPTIKSSGSLAQVVAELAGH